MNRSAQRAKKSVFGSLHKSKKVGEMHDAGRISLGKLYLARDLELAGHLQ
jgi:hypothetical protein